MSLSIPFFILTFLIFIFSVTSTTIILQGNTTLQSPNKTFELGLFNFSQGPTKVYLAIRRTALPTPNTIWVANRLTPAPSLAGSTLQLTQTGQLLLTHSNTTLWSTSPFTPNLTLHLLDSGNLLLLNHDGVVSWQSFDFPSHAWVPGMNLTRFNSLTCWRTDTDPSPGPYSLRLQPPLYARFDLLFNNTLTYWSTGNWTNSAFPNVPEMSVPYLYSFHFLSPFSPAASFGFSQRPSDSGYLIPTMFLLQPYGQLRQYTWNNQSGSWNMFWAKPEPLCQVPRLCGTFGLCSGDPSSTLCLCLPGFKPFDPRAWAQADYSSGCYRGNVLCHHTDAFHDLGRVTFRFGNVTVVRVKSISFCEHQCLASCGCVGFSFDQGTGFCKIFYGFLSDFQNSTAAAAAPSEVLYVRVPCEGSGRKGFHRKVLSGVVIGVVALLGVLVLILLVMVRKRGRKKEDGFVPVLNLKVFSYKELQLATRGFSEKVGHGGFGTVFQGELSDGSVVAVKRLERPGGGEKEFRAEVSTIGNIQHVNLVRLRGFCSENSHRLLVYEFMQNGALSVYLRKEGPSLSWDVRFRVAVGTAKGLTYLHEECRCCIIHCDIKPENILLDADFTAKVSDFGLAKLIGRDFSRVLATMRGTWGYVAPEWISGVAITTKADVYSYGMTLLELIGGRRNVEAPPSAGGGEESGGETGGKWFFPPWAAQRIIEGKLCDVMDKRLGNVYNIEEARRIALVAVWCIQDDEEMRPTMGMVAKMLEGLVEVNVPPPPKLLQALVTGDSFHGVKADSANGVSTGGSLSDGNLEVSTADSESYAGNVFSPLDVNVNDSVR